MRVEVMNVVKKVENKTWFESKTMQGIVLAVGAVLWGLWSGESDTSQTVMWLGLGWAGIGVRTKMGMKKQ